MSELAGRYPRLGALLLTLPIVSIVAFTMTWTKSHDMDAINRLARETLILVPLGLPFFLPMAFHNRTGLTFWPSLGLGLLLATITIGMWFWIGPSEMAKANVLEQPAENSTGARLK